MAKIALSDLNRIKSYLKEETIKPVTKSQMEAKKNKQIEQWANELLKVREEDEKRAFEKF